MPLLRGAFQEFAVAHDAPINPRFTVVKNLTSLSKTENGAAPIRAIKISTSEDLTSLKKKSCLMPFST
jgi:hypothetical protein